MENGENFLRTQKDASWTSKLREIPPVWKTDVLAVNHNELSGILNSDKVLLKEDPDPTFKILGSDEWNRTKTIHSKS